MVSDSYFTLHVTSNKFKGYTKHIMLCLKIIQKPQFSLKIYDSIINFVV